jgi:hypothetical protein
MFTTLVMRNAIAHEGRLCRPDYLNVQCGRAGRRPGGGPVPLPLTVRLEQFTRFPLRRQQPGVVKGWGLPAVRPQGHLLRFVHERSRVARCAGRARCEDRTPVPRTALRRDAESADGSWSRPDQERRTCTRPRRAVPTGMHPSAVPTSQRSGMRQSTTTGVACRRRHSPHYVSAAHNVVTLPLRRATITGGP